MVVEVEKGNEGLADVNLVAILAPPEEKIQVAQRLGELDGSRSLLGF